MQIAVLFVETLAVASTPRELHFMKKKQATRKYFGIY